MPAYVQPKPRNTIFVIVVDLSGRQFTVRARKAKTRRDRRLPISARLIAVLEMRKLDPSGEPFGGKAFVFGNAVGEQVRSLRTAWGNACRRAGLHDLHLADLRHEAASRFEEAGVPTTYVSKFLGHQNLTTTSRYLNITLKGLHRAIDQLEASRNADFVASSLQDPPDPDASSHVSGEGEQWP